MFVKCAERANLRLQSRFSYASSVNPDLRMYTRMMMLSLAVIMCFTCQNAKLIPPNTYPARRLKCRKSLLCLPPRKMTPCLDPAGPYTLHVPDEFSTSHHIIATRGSGLLKVTKHKIEFQAVTALSESVPKPYGIPPNGGPQRLEGHARAFEGNGWDPPDRFSSGCVEKHPCEESKKHR